MSAIAEALIQECRFRLMEEGLPRLKKCLSFLSEGEVWRRPNEQTPSAGNLILHLCGNVTQWIVCGLGGAKDERDRDAEFAQRGPLPKTELLRRLESTLALADRALEELDPATLMQKRRIQGEVRSGVEILVHVTEHFSYHVGQVTYIVKSTKAADTGYYEGQDLNRK